MPHTSPFRLQIRSSVLSLQVAMNFPVAAMPIPITSVRCTWQLHNVNSYSPAIIHAVTLGKVIATLKSPRDPSAFFAILYTCDMHFSTIFYNKEGLKDRQLHNEKGWTSVQFCIAFWTTKALESGLHLYITRNGKQRRWNATSQRGHGQTPRCSEGVCALSRKIPWNLDTASCSTVWVL